MYCPAPATPWLPSLQWLPGEDTRPPARCKVMSQSFQKIFYDVTLPGLECGEVAVYCAPAATMARPGLACGDTGCAEVE